MNDPKITIVTPSFNQGQYIEETILSVISQGYGNFEYIIIDGGSTDNTVDILKKYDSSIDYWHSKKDSGQSNAINTGLSMAQGDILCWLNSDDKLTEGALSRVRKNIDHTKDSWLVGSAYSINSKGKRIKQRLVKQLTPFSFFRYKQNWIAQPSVFWSRSLWEQLGGLDESLNYIMDLDLFYRMFRIVEPIQIPDVLSEYCVHSGAKTSQFPHQVDAEYRDWIFSKIKDDDNLARPIIDHYIQLQRCKRTIDEHIVISKIARFWKKFVNPDMYI